MMPFSAYEGTSGTSACRSQMLPACLCQRDFEVNLGQKLGKTLQAPWEQVSLNLGTKSLVGALLQGGGGSFLEEA